MASTKGYVLTDADAPEDVYCSKIVTIGDWNMDSTSSVTVAHGLTLSDIRSITATIRNDDHSGVYCLASDTSEDDSGAEISADATNVTLARITSGAFDSTSFNATSYNRGWVTIIYGLS